MGGGPPAKAPHRSHPSYRTWIAVQKAKKAQDEKAKNDRDKTTQKTLIDILFNKRVPPKKSEDTRSECSQASSWTAVNPESVVSVTSTGPTSMTESFLNKLSQSAKCCDPVTLKNMGNTCFVNARK